jgi:signal transduction histidine kinase/ActR/RegA family two-component response regulator/PAS domain-containing protein
MSIRHQDAPQRSALLPTFARRARSVPDVGATMREFARFGYRDNPLPPLFKERLFVWLSRFCDCRHSLARHIALLLGHDHAVRDPACPVQSIDDVVGLLREPLARGAALRQHVAHLADRSAPLADIPPADSPLERSLFACAAHVFLRTPAAASCQGALQRALGGVRLQQLLVLLTFVSAEQFWNDVHPEFAFADDIERLLAAHAALRPYLIESPQPRASESGNRLLQQQLEDSQLLHEISLEMIGERDVQALYDRILDAATRLMRSQFASIQVLESSPGSAGELRLLGHRGFGDEAAAFWKSVGSDSGSICAEALRRMQRIVVADLDDYADSVGAQDLAMLRRSGIRAVQTTPLRARSGALVGMLSTHWSEPHEASARELQLLDILARQAADLIEVRLSEAAREERDRKYRALFDSIDEGFCILERNAAGAGERVDFLCVEANPTFRAESNIDDAAGRMMREALPDEPETTFAIFDEVLRSGEAQRFERVVAARGRVLELYAFRLDDGSARRLGVTFKDITGRKRREATAALLGSIGDDFARLADTHELMQTVGARLGEFLRLSTCLFADMEPAQGLAHVAHCWCRAGAAPASASYRVDDFLGAAASAELHAGTVVVVADARQQAQARAFAALGVAATVCVPVLRAGQWRFLLLLADSRPRNWRRHEIELLRELAHRVFPRLERARAEDALRASEERLRRADRTKDEFLATLAHELRNPLAPIRNALHLLRLSEPGPRSERLHEMLERQVTHIVRLVDDLLEVSRISRGVIDLKREPVVLNQVLRVAAETSRPLIEQGRHRLQLTLPDEALTLCGDPVRLAQVFANLLNNAAKYTDEGGVIELRARRDAHCAVVEVRDSGIGIAAEQLPRLFELFTQVDRTTVRAQGGLGIGLWLAQRLVAMHGGSVHAHSDGLGHGSCFSVRLPLMEAAATSPREPVAIAPSFGRRRVLVVDDNADAADSLGMLLGVLGADARVEHDGGAALGVLETWRPAVVLLDLGMPLMDGFEVARRIRADRRHDHVMLVAVTGWGQEKDRQRTRAAGFDHHLVKPFDLDALQKVLAEASVAADPDAPT